MTADTTTDDWGYGEDYGEDRGYLDEPEVVTPTVVTPPVTPGVTRPVTPGATPGVTPPVTPGGNDPLPVGHWEEVTPGQDWPQDNSGEGLLARLLTVARTSPLLGGGSLAAELADPQPHTWSQHWTHVRSHKNLPEGKGAAAGFTAGHLLVTGPLKLTGKVMTVTGNVLTWTGKRTDRAADNFTAALIFIFLAAAVIVLVVIGASQLLASLSL